MATFDPDAYLAQQSFDPDAYLKSVNVKPAQQQNQSKKRAWSDVPLEAIQNIPDSAGNFLSGIAQVVSHPIDTASTLFDAAAGGLKNALPKSAANLLDKIDYNPKATERAVNTANAVGNIYKNRYGSMEGLKETLATDPVGFAGDLSTILGAGSSLAAKAPKVSAALNAGANYTNPFNAIAPVAGYIGEKASPIFEIGAKKLMQSALKPTIEQLRKGQAETAINTLLSEGINATRGGVEKLKDRVGSINDEITNLITNSSATVDKQKVLDTLAKTKDKFRTQVSPTSDLNAIENVALDFANHPMINADSIPVQLAQQLKQGTYRTLDKKYGQIGSAETEAQKALARGLKEGVSEAVPEVTKLNAKESDLINTLKVTERRALMDANKNPMGLSLLANNPASWAAFMADKSALFKSLVARTLNQMSQPNKLADSLRSLTPEQTRLLLLSNQAGQQNP
jgi:hypothetical protein